MPPAADCHGRCTRAVLALLLALLATRSNASQQPNVLLIVADDLGWGDVSFAQLRTRGDRYDGSQVVRTPELEEMARAGIRLSRFYAASPVCSPTRASLLTGRHGRRHRIDEPLFLESEGKLRNRELTIAELAQACGYRTGHFGKWHVGSLTKHTYDMRRGRVGNFRHHSAPWHNGYDVVFACENWMPTFDPYGGFPTNRVAQAAYFTGRSTPDLAARVPTGDASVHGLHESQIVVDAAARFVRETVADRVPFFATVWFSTPHVPLAETPITAFDGLGLSAERRRYCEAILAMDAQIGRLRRLLREVKVACDTLVVFTSDNGPDRLEVGGTGGLRGKKGTLYEGGIRVPTLAEWPSVIPAPTESIAPVSSNDILPTLCDVWGLPRRFDRPLDGRSALGVLKGERPAGETPFRLFTAHGRGLAALGPRYKLIQSTEGTGAELYDLLNDPAERHDLLAAGGDAPTDRRGAGEPGRPDEARTTSGQRPGERGMGNPNAATATRVAERLATELESWLAEADASRAGDDLPVYVRAISGAQVVEAVAPSLPLEQSGVDRFGAPIFEDRLQISDGRFESPHLASVFVERQYATLRCDLPVNSFGDVGHYDAGSTAAPRRLGRGAVVHSFLVQSDPPNDGRQRTQEIELAFDHPIVAVIGRGGWLAESDHLAFADPVFPAAASDRGLFDSPEDRDRWSVSGDGKRLRLWFETVGGIDQVRVLTATSLDPAMTRATTVACSQPQEAKKMIGPLSPSQKNRLYQESRLYSVASSHVRRSATGPPSPGRKP